MLNLSASGLDVLKCKMSFCSTYRARILDIIKRGEGNFDQNGPENDLQDLCNMQNILLNARG